MKRIFAFAFAALMIAAALAGCASAPKAGTTIKIGWIGSLTGDSAVWGTNESNMLKMLVEETNASGGLMGRQVELICYDTKGDANEAVNAARRIASQDGVCAIIGPNASSHCIAMQGVLEELKLSDISTCGTNPKITVDADTGAVHPYNFRVCFTDPYQGAIAGGYAYDELGFTKAAILYDISDDYSQGLTQYFIDTFTGRGGQIIAQEAFKKDDVDFRAQLTKIKETNPEVLFLPIYYKEVALIAKQARELGIEAVLMGGDGWPSDMLFEMAKEELQGSYIVNHLDVNDPEFAPLKEKFESKYNTTLEMNGYMAHDAYLVLVAAIEKAGGDGRAAITAALTEVSVEGVTGTIKLSAEDHNPIGKEGSIVKIEGDTYQFIQKYGAK
ncbi:MAG: ABC transporter substrate-binding protein [Christensenellaceae bacterium]|jgi:branched-chain amino acid transport system substrate-binding protein|nr:ABC transporter substrate-binding protein [Christensenellaceae bacterium]